MTPRAHAEQAHSLIAATHKSVQGLVHYHWPGNIHELRNVLECARLFADDGVIRPERLPNRVGQPANTAPAAVALLAGPTHVGHQVRRFRGTRTAP